MSGREEEMSIPHATRAEIIARDGHCCRLCGQWAEVHVHHITYRSQGGKNVAENLISLDWKCHERVHRSKPLWLPILQQVALTPGVNGLQLLRWYEASDPLVLHSDGPDDCVCVWAENPGGNPSPITRTFRVIPTGGDVPDGIYLGTVFDGPFVWHVYEVTAHS